MMETAHSEAINQALVTTLKDTTAALAKVPEEGLDDLDVLHRTLRDALDTARAIGMLNDRGVVLDGDSLDAAEHLLQAVLGVQPLVQSLDIKLFEHLATVDGLGELEPEFVRFAAALTSRTYTTARLLTKNLGPAYRAFFDAQEES